MPSSVAQGLLSGIAICLVQDLHSVVFLPIATVESHVEQPNFVRIAKDRLRISIIHSLAN
jgi:hypothetical protein